MSASLVHDDDVHGLRRELLRIDRCPPEPVKRPLERRRDWLGKRLAARIAHRGLAQLGGGYVTRGLHA